MLDAFSHPISLYEALEKLQMRITGAQDWMDLMSTIAQLHEASVLREETQNQPTLRTDPSGYDAAPIHVAMLNDRARTSSLIAGIYEVIRPGDIVVDIGSNDGTLLRQYTIPGLITVGFEPSNLYELGTEGTSRIIHDYFNHTVFKREFGTKKAKVITSIAMFYDLEDPGKFVEDTRKCLHEDGLWIIQMNYLGLMLENNSFDNISHEHLEYYSLMSLEYLLGRHDMEVFDVELNDVNGGSFRVFVRHRTSELKASAGSEERLRALRAHEKEMALDRVETYDAFATRINAAKSRVLDFLKHENEKGKTIFIYGASTRGLVVLQYFGIDSRLIKGAADKNPDKWGKYIVGTGIPIMSVDEYRKRKPDYLLVLPYHFLKEIEEQEKAFLELGGKMIVTIPDFKVVCK